MSESIHYAEHGTGSSAPFCARKNYEGMEADVEAVFSGTTWMGTDNAEGVTCTACIERLAEEVERAVTETPEALKARLNDAIANHLQKYVGARNSGLTREQMQKELFEVIQARVPDVSGLEIVHDPVSPDAVTVRYKQRMPKPVGFIVFKPFVFKPDG